MRSLGKIQRRVASVKVADWDFGASFFQLLQQKNYTSYKLHTWEIA